METRIYLGDAFGWETESTAKVAISQLREKGKTGGDCPKAQLVKNGSIRWMANTVKILGYIPGLNVIAGIVTLCSIANSNIFRQNHKQLWILRGVSMIFTGPLLAIVDLIKFIFDCKIVSKYNREHKENIEKFNTSHEHSNPPWPGHPVRCFEESSRVQVWKPKYKAT